MNVDIVGKFHLGNGGIGDALIFLSTFYDDVEEANVIFLANEPSSIKELFSYFPKLKKKLILQNDFRLLGELYHHPNCIGTGIIPKNLDYSTWYKVDIFKEYGVKEFPKFMNLFPAIRINEPQLFIQQEGSKIEGGEKKRIITKKTWDEIFEIAKTGGFKKNVFPTSNLYETICLIRGSDLLIGVDSFAKTVSAMSRIKTIVYDNVYEPSYLAKFKDGVDYGHYVFIFPWSHIEFRPQ